MAKKITLNDIAAMITKQGKEIHDLTNTVDIVVKHMATKDDVAEIRKDMATNDQVYSLQTQVNSIEQQLRETRTEVRLGDLEDKVFGAPRG